MVEIDLDAEHGTKTNPYVIDSPQRWNAFADDMGDTSQGITNYGKDKYFVLADDLDFLNTAFKPVPRFEGTFYGLGHTISNVSYDSNKDHMGLFKMTFGNILVADVNLINYSYSNIQLVGGIVGVALPTSSYKIACRFLNCHTQGEIIRQNNGTDFKAGGIIGHFANQYVESELLIYRCSTKVDYQFTEANLPYEAGFGPLVGQILQKAKTTILDCYGEINVDIKSIAKIGYHAAFVPVVNQITQPLRLENCAGKIRVNGNSNVASGLLKNTNSIIGMTNNGSSLITPSVIIKDVYVVGEAEQGGVVYNAYPHTTGSVNNTYFGNPTFSASNVYYAGSGSSMFPLNSDYISNTKLTNASTKVSVSQLWSNAKAATAFSSNVWTNKNAIGDTYSV
ncbi:MAG: hypothetical protein K2L37_06480, partial [Lactobacillus sp.]|nr:hypothetical protein [Lactobacillus sp.]